MDGAKGQRGRMGRELARRFEREALSCRDQLYRSALRLTRSRVDAEDLVQETLTRACAGFGGFRSGTNIRAWLHRIMVNSYINSYRKWRREPVMLSGSVDELAAYRPPPLPSPITRSAEAQALDLMPAPELARAVRRLPAEFATAVYLTDVEGLSYRETAQYMGTPVGTVMSRLHRGRRALRAWLTESDSSPQKPAHAASGQPTALAASGASEPARRG